jgi:hypothetical protein
MKVKLGPEDPLVKEALCGVYRSSCKKLFFRIEDGEHRKVSVARELAHLDRSSTVQKVNILVLNDL